MNTYPIIMALMGQYPLKLSTKNDPEISCRLLKYDDTKLLASVEMEKVISSENITLQIQSSDALYEYNCVIDFPSDCTKTNLKIKSVEVKESPRTIVCRSEVSITINSDEILGESPPRSASNPVCFYVVNANENGIFVYVNSSEQSKLFESGKHVKINIGALGVQSFEVLSVEGWGYNTLLLSLKDVNLEVLESMSKSHTEMSTHIGIEWDNLVKTGGLKV